MPVLTGHITHWQNSKTMYTVYIPQLIPRGCLKLAELDNVT